MPAVAESPRSLIDPLQTVEERLNKMHGEARGALSRNTRYWCPYGCRKPQCDDYGFCKHFLGFTNTVLMTGEEEGICEAPEGTEYEPTGTLYRFNAKGEPFDTDLKQTSCLNIQTTQPGDVLVNRERIQTTNGYQAMSKELVSSYVFRKNVTDQPVKRPSALPVSEEMRLTNIHRELQRREEKNRLALEVATLKNRLGEPLEPHELELVALHGGAVKSSNSDAEHVALAVAKAIGQEIASTLAELVANKKK